MALSLAGLWLWADGPLWFIVLAFCFYAFVSGGPGVLAWVYPNELFPTEVRATALGFIISFTRIGAATGIYLLPISISVLGIGVTMLFGAILTVFAFAVCLAFAPETRGKTLDEASALFPVTTPTAGNLQASLD